MKLDVSIDLDTVTTAGWDEMLGNLIRDEIVSAVRAEVKKVIKENNSKFRTATEKVLGQLDQKAISKLALQALFEAIPRDKP